MKIEKIELNSDGIREMLRSDECRELVGEYAEKAVDRLGDGYEADTYRGPGRVNASVSAVTTEAVRDNLKDNRVIKAVLIK